jgi:dTDP-4-dehydrorhamnose reductase
VNAAAYTKVDLAESEADRAMLINGEAPGVLAREAVKLNALLVHFSTDYVFDGTKTEPYVESDSTKPLGVYGRSKLAGEEAVRAVGGPHLLFRLCWVYAARGHNFMLTIMRLAQEREKLRVVKDQAGCPTPARMIAETVALALRKAVAAPDGSEFTGTYHLASTGAASWHEFAQAIVGSMPPEDRKCREVEAIATAEYPTPARRPAYSVLDCGKLERAFGLRLPHWTEGLRQTLDLDLSSCPTTPANP